MLRQTTWKEKGNQKSVMITNELIIKVVNAGSKVHKALGSELSHDIYEDCIVYELSKQEIKAEKQKPISLKYEELEFPVAFNVDIFVENKMVVGLRPVNIDYDTYCRFIEGYIKNCNSPVGLILDFSTSNFRSGVRIVEKSSFKPISHPLVYTDYQYGSRKNKK